MSHHLYSTDKPEKDILSNKVLEIWGDLQRNSANCKENPKTHTLTVTYSITRTIYGIADYEGCLEEDD